MQKSEQEDIFNSWLKSYDRLLFKVVRVYAVDQHDQNDLFQEIIIQVWKSIPQFQCRSKPSTWIYRVAINTSLKWKARQAVEAKRTNQTKEDTSILKLAVTNEIDERVEWLYQEINKLTEIDRSIALLILEGYSYKEMAEIVGISTSYIGVKINRIKKQLTAQLKKYSIHGI